MTRGEIASGSKVTAATRDFGKVRTRTVPSPRALPRTSIATVHRRVAGSRKIQRPVRRRRAAADRASSSKRDRIRPSFQGPLQEIEITGRAGMFLKAKSTDMPPGPRPGYIHLCPWVGVPGRRPSGAGAHPLSERIG